MTSAVHSWVSSTETTPSRYWTTEGRELGAGEPVSAPPELCTIAVVIGRSFFNIRSEALTQLGARL